MTIWLWVCLCLTCLLSDHFLVNINVSLQKQSVWARVISYRKYKSIDEEAFFFGWSASLFSAYWILRMRDIVDDHAPLRIKEMPRRLMLPWYNNNMQAVKRHRRSCGRSWIKTSSCVHCEIFKASKILVKDTFAPAKSEYYYKKIKASKGNQGLFQGCE